MDVTHSKPLHVTKLNANLWTVRPGAILAPSLVAHWITAKWQRWRWRQRQRQPAAATHGIGPLAKSKVIQEERRPVNQGRRRSHGAHTGSAKS